MADLPSFIDRVAIAFARMEAGVVTFERHSSIMPQTLLAHVNVRFREAFGDPDTSLAKDHHWTIRAHPDAMPINVLLNGSRSPLTVWIFDPYDRAETMSIVVTAVGDIDRVIAQIRDRLERTS